MPKVAYFHMKLRILALKVSELFSYLLSALSDISFLAYRAIFSKERLLVVAKQTFEKILLPEYQSNDTGNCLVIFLICPINFRNLPRNRPFLPIEMGDFLSKAPF